MNIDRDVEIIKNLIEYLQEKVDRGEHKIIYNSDMHDEKTVDCINALENVLENSVSEEEIKEKECYLIQQDDENSNWYKCSNCKQEFYWGETVDDMKRSSIKYCNFCGSKIKEVVYMEDKESEE